MLVMLLKQTEKQEKEFYNIEVYTVAELQDGIATYQQHFVYNGIYTHSKKGESKTDTQIHADLINLMLAIDAVILEDENFAEPLETRRVYLYTLNLEIIKCFNGCWIESVNQYADKLQVIINKNKIKLQYGDFNEFRNKRK